MDADDAELGLFFPGLMEHICSICGQEIFEWVNDKETQKVSVNEVECSGTQAIHFAHRSCLEIAAQKKLTFKIDTYCSDCKILLTDEKVIQEEIQR